MPDVSCVECFLLIDAPLEHNGCGPLCRRCYRYKVQLGEHAAAQARIAQLEAELAEARKDSARLDWLESRRLALNDHYKTHYGWKFVSSHNVNRLYVKDVNTIDIHDSDPRSPDIRSAIDAAMKEPHA